MALVKPAAPYDLDVARDMQLAHKRHGAGLGKQVSDFMALRMSGAGLSFEEYIYFGLYARDRSEYGAYMGDHRARAAFYIANDLSKWDDAEDKVAFYDCMTRAGLPTPQIDAVAHQTREASGAVTLCDLRAVEDYLAHCAPPLFGKPAIASHGDGAVKIIAREGDRLMLADGECTIKDIVSEIAPYFAQSGYLFQEVLTPHPDLASITGGRIATMRLMVWLGPDGPSVRHAALRFPAGDHCIDNFRRAGNLVAYVDRGTGQIGPAHRGVGVASEALSAHPDSGARIEGVIAPDFEAAKDVVLRAAQVFPSLHIQSWDIALTDTGPSLLELNPGGNLNIIQLASGRGAFDPEFRTFLEWCAKQNAGAHANPKALKEARKLLQLKS